MDRQLEVIESAKTNIIKVLVESGIEERVVREILINMQENSDIMVGTRIRNMNLALLAKRGSNNLNFSDEEADNIYSKLLLKFAIFKLYQNRKALGLRIVNRVRLEELVESYGVSDTEKQVIMDWM